MSMSKKEYVALAKMVRNHMPEAIQEASPDGGRFVLFVMDLAEYCKKENHMFDTQKFYTACGFTTGEGL